MFGQDAGVAREDVPQRGEAAGRRPAVVFILIACAAAEYSCCALTRG